MGLSVAAKSEMQTNSTSVCVRYVLETSTATPKSGRSIGIFDYESPVSDFSYHGLFLLRV